VNLQLPLGYSRGRKRGDFGVLPPANSSRAGASSASVMVQNLWPFLRHRTLRTRWTIPKRLPRRKQRSWQGLHRQNPCLRRRTAIASKLHPKKIAQLIDVLASWKSAARLGFIFFYFH